MSELTDYLSGLAGLTVTVDQRLTGASNAVIEGRELHVSPAMYSLMRNASPDELQKLCEQIGCLDTNKYEMKLIMIAKKIPDSLKGWI